MQYVDPKASSAFLASERVTHFLPASTIR